MSKPRVIKVTFIDPYESDISDVGSSIDPTYIPSQTPESEDYSSLESSQYSVCSLRVNRVLVIPHHVVVWNKQILYCSIIAI